MEPGCERRAILERLRRHVPANSGWGRRLSAQLAQAEITVGVHLAIFVEPFLTAVLDARATGIVEKSSVAEGGVLSGPRAIGAPNPIPADKKNHRRKAAAQLHDYVLFMANTGLRPDEAARLQYRDVAIVDDAATGEQILEISVRGKRGTGYCKSTRGAVRPFERIRDRNVNDRPTKEELKKRKAEGGKESERKAAPPKPTDLLFPSRQTMLLNKVLAETGLKEDREGQARTAYSLRHTYICMRLMEGADIYQVAKNCRTSVEMIEKYYASHIKTRLDAAAINIRRY